MNSVAARYLAGQIRYCHFCAGLYWQLGYKTLTMLCEGHRMALKRMKLRPGGSSSRAPSPAPQPARAPGRSLGGGA